MAALNETPTWEPSIYQLEQTDLVLGGASGISNEQAIQLANRTLWLKNSLTAFVSIQSINANHTLTVGEVINSLVLIDANNATITVGLPDAGDVPIGTRAYLKAINVNKSQVTISTTDSIIVGGATRTKIYLGSGDDALFVLVPAGWLLLQFDGNLLTVGKPSYSYKAEPNTIIANGQLLKRVDYPRLWEFVQTLGASLVSDFTWNNTAGYKGFFSTGDNATNFRVPDLRSMFFRGLDLAAGVDFGRTVESPGGYEADELKAHTHQYKRVRMDIVGPQTQENRAKADDDVGLYEGDTVTTTSTGGTETRPKNIGLIPLINI